MVRVRLRVEARTWDAFRLLALEGRSGAEAARQLGMKVATVFVARSKVQKMLAEEVHKLDAPAGSAPEAP
jgi:RNA polymerase sigma-70 factor (ECF subfamily)